MGYCLNKRNMRMETLKQSGFCKKETLKCRRFYLTITCKKEKPSKADGSLQILL